MKTSMPRTALLVVKEAGVEGFHNSTVLVLIP